MADFLGLMKQAAELKSKMEAMQAELERLEVEGAAGANPAREETREQEEAAVAALTRRYLEIIEQEIRDHPHMWLWMHRRWDRKQTPPQT